MFHRFKQRTSPDPLGIVNDINRSGLSLFDVFVAGMDEIKLNYISMLNGYKGVKEVLRVMLGKLRIIE